MVTQDSSEQDVQNQHASEIHAGEEWRGNLSTPSHLLSPIGQTWCHGEIDSLVILAASRKGLSHVLLHGAFIRI